MHQSNGYMNSYTANTGMYPVYYCFSLALVLAAIGVQDRVLLVHMDNPGVPSTSLYCILAGFDGIILFRSTSDPRWQVLRDRATVTRTGSSAGVATKAQSTQQ